MNKEIFPAWVPESVPKRLRTESKQSSRRASNKKISLVAIKARTKNSFVLLQRALTDYQWPQRTEKRLRRASGEDRGPSSALAQHHTARIQPMSTCKPPVSEPPELLWIRKMLGFGQTSQMESLGVQPEDPHSSTGSPETILQNQVWKPPTNSKLTSADLPKFWLSSPTQTMGRVN